MNRRTKAILFLCLALLASTFLTFALREKGRINQQTDGASYSRMMGYGAGLFGCVLVLGLLAAYQFSHFVGNKAEEFFFNDGGEPVHDPDYDDAEKLWADGQHLEAINHLREFLKRDPRQMHAAIRIAEIYEKDLRNPLAAALEYQEILTNKLPPERWGWAAVHLVNLFSGPLNQPDQAMALLERIATEYPNTGAARKARARLGLPEPEPVAPAETTTEAGESETSEAATPQAAPVEAPKSNLPPGFRPK